MSVYKVRETKAYLAIENIATKYPVMFSLYLAFLTAVPWLIDLAPSHPIWGDEMNFGVFKCTVGSVPLAMFGMWVVHMVFGLGFQFRIRTERAEGEAQAAREEKIRQETRMDTVRRIQELRKHS